MSDSFSAGASALSDGHDYDTESEDENDQERRAVVSLLKAVSAADIARSRKTKRNEPPHGKRQRKGAVISDPRASFLTAQSIFRRTTGHGTTRLR